MTQPLCSPNQVLEKHSSVPTKSPLTSARVVSTGSPLLPEQPSASLCARKEGPLVVARSYSVQGGVNHFVGKYGCHVHYTPLAFTQAAGLPPPRLSPQPKSSKHHVSDTKLSNSPL